MDDEYEFNFRIVFWGAFIFILLISFVYVSLPTPQKEVVNNENESKVIQIEYIYITVTPTPDGKEYFASEYQNGTRKLGREFSFLRYNTSGYKSTSIHANVYDYREFNSYHWFNPTDYTYYEEYPSKPNKKFMFIFAYIYMDDVIGDDARMWIPSEKQYVLQSQSKLYYPITDFPKQLRIKELEDVSNSNDDYKIGYYASQRSYANTEDNRKTAGEYAIEYTWLKGGKSNKIDGYIIFEVDKEDKIEDMQVNVNYFALGDSSWKLKV